MKAIFATLALLALTAGAQAHEFKSGDIVIDRPWARPTIGMARTGAGYMTIENKGKTVDRLVGITAPSITPTAEMHTHIMDGDVMRMREVPAVDVPAGGSVAFKPGSYHVMFIGLKQPLLKDERFAATLEFEKAGNVPIEFVVGEESDGGHGKPMKMDGKK